MPKGLSVAIIAGPKPPDGGMSFDGEDDDMAMRDAVDGMMEAAKNDDRGAFLAFLMDWHSLAHANDA